MRTTIIIIIALIIGGGVFFVFRSKPTPQSARDISPSVLRNDLERFELFEKHIRSGGPPKDGIPAIDEPKYTSPEEADNWLRPDDVVFGLDYKGFTAAYPQRILVWHEITNETIDGKPVSITYCPLTGTVIGYKGNFKDQETTFGVSGKLLNSNLLMYDRATDSYWPQIVGKAMNGEMAGSSLEEFPLVWTTWERWRNAYPQTKVLSRETGFLRNYDVGGDPYGSYLGENKGYYTSERILFEPIYKDDRLPPKTVVVGIRDTDYNAVAVLKETLRNEGVVEVSLGENSVILTYDQTLDSYTALYKTTGEWVNAFNAMWFSWVAFYPETELVK